MSAEPRVDHQQQRHWTVQHEFEVSGFAVNGKAIRPHQHPHLDRFFQEQQKHRRKRKHCYKKNGIHKLVIGFDVSAIARMRISLDNTARFK
jgi:hypothetical protein